MSGKNVMGGAKPKKLLFTAASTALPISSSSGVSNSEINSGTGISLVSILDQLMNKVSGVWYVKSSNCTDCGKKKMSSIKGSYDGSSLQSIQQRSPQIMCSEEFKDIAKKTLKQCTQVYFNSMKEASTNLKQLRIFRSFGHIELNNEVILFVTRQILKILAQYRYQPMDILMDRFMVRRKVVVGDIMVEMREYPQPDQDWVDHYLCVFTHKGDVRITPLMNMQGKVIKFPGLFTFYTPRKFTIDVKMYSIRVQRRKTVLKEQKISNPYGIVSSNFVCNGSLQVTENLGNDAEIPPFNPVPGFHLKSFRLHISQNRVSLEI